MSETTYRFEEWWLLWEVERVAKGKFFHQTQHCMKYRHDWWRDQDTCNPCDEDYSQEKHIVLIVSQAYENCTG